MFKSIECLIGILNLRYALVNRSGSRYLTRDEPSIKHEINTARKPIDNFQWLFVDMPVEPNLWNPKYRKIRVYLCFDTIHLTSVTMHMSPRPLTVHEYLNVTWWCHVVFLAVVVFSSAAISLPASLLTYPGTVVLTTNYHRSYHHLPLFLPSTTIVLIISYHRSYHQLPSFSSSATIFLTISYHCSYHQLPSFLPSPTIVLIIISSPSHGDNDGTYTMYEPNWLIKTGAQVANGGRCLMWLVDWLTR